MAYMYELCVCLKTSAMYLGLIDPSELVAKKSGHGLLYKIKYLSGLYMYFHRARSAFHTLNTCAINEVTV
jgi:hypothetical protein